MSNTTPHWTDYLPIRWVVGIAVGSFAVSFVVSFAAAFVAAWVTR